MLREYLLVECYTVKTRILPRFFVAICLVTHASISLAQNGSPSDSLGSSSASGNLGRNTIPLTVVSPDQNAEDTAIGPFDLDFVAKHPELEWTAPDFPENKPYFASPSQTLLALSRNVTLRHEVWGLEFSFKPARLIEVDIPVASGGTQKKVVWYLLYKVRYTGQDLAPKVENESEIPEFPSKVNFDSVRFLPYFVLVSKERKLSMDAQILPTAKSAIAARERVGKPIYDHIEIGKRDIPLSSLDADNSFWGIATWTDVDPRLDFFAIDVRGLTNAYRIRIDESGKKNFDRKTLRIYFWRPGDVIDVAKDRIYLGLPALENRARMDYLLQQFNLKERLDYEWIYR